VNAAVPMLLAALGSTASSRDGARNIHRVIQFSEVGAFRV
jgi:hypothetical protein